MDPSQVMFSLAVTMPEIFLAVAAMVLLLAGTWLRKNAAETVTYAAIMSLVAVIAIVVLSPMDAPIVFAWSNMVVVDDFTRFAFVVIPAAAAMALLISPSYMVRVQAMRPEYPVLVLFATLGMMIMVAANDLMSVYVGVELQSLSLYVLASFRRDQARASEAGLKYFVLGSVASAVLLYGISLIYGSVGHTGFGEIAYAVKMAAAPAGDGLPLGLVFGLVFICAALAFKVSAVPFHMWTPDVYEGAPAPVTAFFAAVPKIAALALMARILLQPLGGLEHEWVQIIVVAAVASMILGGLGGLAQSNLRRLMAYSSIANIGAALVGLAVGGDVGIQAMLTYIIIYAVNTLGAFAVIVALRRSGQEATQIRDMAGMSQSHPILALAMAIFMFSLAGVPPLAGFFGKYFVFMAAIEAGMLPLAIIGVLASVVAAVYYLRIVKVMYFDEPRTDVDRLDAVPERTITFAVGLSAAAVLLLIIAPSPLLSLTLTAAKALIVP